MHHHHHIGGYTSRGCRRAIACLATIISMVYTSPGCRRIMHRHLHVDGLHSMSMGYTSPGCRRVMPRLTSGWPKVATHRVQMTTPLLFGVGAEGGHIGSK